MPLFEKLDRKKKMEIIKAGEKKIKEAIEVMLKQKKDLLLSEGYTEAQADVFIEELRGEVSRKSIIQFQEKIRALEKTQSTQLKRL